MVNKPIKVKMIDIVPRSCKGVAIKKINRILVTPMYFKIFAPCLARIFFDIWIKNIPYPTEWNAIPISAQILPVFSKPFIVFAANKLLRKFFDQSKPMEFSSSKEPPG